jgi:NADH:ubiquinone oxidoreductase subunit H
MSIRQRWLALGRIPAVRTSLFFLGWLLIASAPLVGVIPGPGGVIVFAAGAGLVLKYSAWAKRKYARFKRRHPGMGAWADWGMRRRSAQRRVARDQQRPALQAPQGD